MKNKKPFGGEKPRRFAPSAKAKFPGSKPGFKPKRPFGGGESSRDFESGGPRTTGSAKPSFGKKKPFVGERRFEKPAYGERRFEKPAYGERRFEDDRPRRSFEGQERGDFAPRNKSFGGGKPGFKPKPYGAGPGHGSASRPAYGSPRPHGAPRPGGFKRDDRKPYGERPSYGSPRPSSGGSRPYSKDARFEDRPQKQFGGAPRRDWDSKGGGYGDRKPVRSFDSDKPRFGARDDKYGAERRGSDFKKPSRFEDRKPWQRDETDRKPWQREDTESKPWQRDTESRQREPQIEDEQDFRNYKDQGSAPRFHDPDRQQKAEGNTPYVNKREVRDTDQPSKAPMNLKNKTFLPGLTAKKLIVTLEDTKNVPVRLVWIYDSMVGALPDGEPSAGDTVHVHDAQDRFIGSAIYNPNSKIRARIFAVSKQLFNETYISEAIVKAIDLRRSMGFLSGSCRVVFGEADGIPGLIADKIGDYLVIQPLTFAVDRRLSKIVDLLNEQLGPQGIIVRNDAPIRAKEGLEVGEVVTHGDIPERVRVMQDGCVLYANPAGGQKTGLFLDQRLNRETIKPFSKGARVLDLFCHVGGWAMRAAKYGASEVIGVDSSKPALALAEAAATENGFDQVSFVDDDVFDYLRKLEVDSDSLFDIIICDPPAFAKTRAHFEDAFRAYLSLNYLAMKKLKPGGVLVSCSCSQAVSEREFGEALLTAARNARMQFQIIEKRGAPQDHPVLLGLPETDYLKCFVMRRTE